MKKRIFVIAAARPNFMKVAPLWRAFSAYTELFEPVLVHTGQHYDKNMSDVFFDDLSLPKPHIHLGVGGGSHAEQTAGVMVKFEQICLERKPDLVLVVGDVNATMATTITARKLWITVGHIEAGLRSRDRKMPEEINRMLTDAVANYLFTPSPDADENLLAEGHAPESIYRTGNIMIDSLVHSLEKAKDREKYLDFGTEPRQFGLVTLHRPSNVDDPDCLVALLEGLHALDTPLIFPVHPRTWKIMDRHGLFERFTGEGSQLRLTKPMGYDDFLNLTMNARFVITDSGGIQEETTYLGIPCLTLRSTTERPITVTEGTNELVTLDDMQEQARRILAGKWKKGRVPDLWDGRTAERIVEVLRGIYGG